MNGPTILSPDDVFAAAKNRFDRDPEAWKGFTGTVEFVLTSADGEPSVSHLVFEPGELRVVAGPGSGVPVGRVTVPASDLVLLATGVLDADLLCRRGRLRREGDMYVLAKLPTLIVADVPLFTFRTGDAA